MWKYHYTPVETRDWMTAPNGTKTEYDYDDLNRLRQIKSYPAASPTDILTQFDYDELDAVGNRKHVIEQLRNPATEDLDESEVAYAYDDLYRLTGEERTGAHAYTRIYTYDDNGNRQSQTTTIGEETEVRAYNYNAKDQLLEEVVDEEVVMSYAYDANGNQTGKTDHTGVSPVTTTYYWDELDRLVGASGPVSVSYENGDR